MTPSDPRAELERLRKLKRLRELEAKASGSIPAMSTRETTQFPPQANLPDMRVDAVPAERPSRLNAFAEGARTGLTFGTEDEQRAMRALRAQTGGQVGQALNLAGRVIPGFAAADALTGIVADVTGAGGEFRSALEARRAEEQALRAERPVSFMAGEIAGSVAVPVGGSARAATKAGQIAKGIGAGALGGGAYEFASEEGGLQERAQAGLIGAGLGAAAGGLLSSVLPRDIPLGDVLNAELFGTKVDRPVLKTIERILRDSGVAPNDISRGVENIRQRLQSGEVGTGLPTRFKDELVKEFGDNARGLAEAIETQIRGGAAVSGSASDAAVRAMVREDNAAARELFNASLDQFAGSVSRPELRNQALERMGTIVEERYKPLLARNIDDLEKRQKLIDVLNQPRMQALASELAEDAEREGIDLQALINRNPAEAAHWMQRNARQLADDRGTVTVTGQVKPDRRMMNRRQDILNALEDAVPGYRDTRMEYGDQYGVLEAVRFANGFLARSKDDIAVTDMADEFRKMSKAQKDMALASVRSLLAGSAGNVKYVGPEIGESALRVAEIGKEPVLRALSEVFGSPGTALADDIKQIVTRFDLNRRINPQATGSDTVPKAQAVKQAIRATQGPITRTISGLLGGTPLDVVGSAVAGSPLPITAMRMGVRGAGEAADRRAMSTVDRVTEMLLSRPQGRNAFTQGGPRGGGITGGGGPTGSIIEELATPVEGMSAMPEANPFAGPQMAPEPAGNAFTSPYFGRQSMRAARERGPSERVMAMQADWAPVSEGMSQASVSAGEVADMAQQATMIRTGPERQAAAEQAAQMMQAVRRQVQDIQAQRAGMATPEDQRLQDIIDLLEPTSDPVQLQAQATMVQQNLARINQAIGLEEVPRSMPPQQSAARRLGFQPTVRDETAVARERPIAGRYAGAGDDTTPQGFAVPNAFVEAGAGSIGGSVAGQQYDITGDGVIDERDIQAGALMGMAGVPLAARMMRGGGSGMRGMGYTGETPPVVQKAKDAASIRLSVGAKATAALDSGNNIPLRASPADMLKAIDDQVRMTSDEKQAFMRVFGNKVKMTRGEAQSFFETVADPRNHFSHNIDGFGAIAQRMTNEELLSLSARTAPQVVSILEDLRRIAPVQESAAVAVAGGAKKGWYLRSQEALRQVFGDDAPRFAAVLAALSPQTSVESNLANTVNFWANWTRAGRPTDEKSILRILGQSVQGNKGDDSVLGAWQNNTVRAIQAVDPEEALLSGPKVDSFRRNLRGRNVQDATSGSNQPTRRGANSVMDDTEYAVTNDAWMANYFNVNQELFARGGGQSQPGYSPGYLATNVYVREVAEHLSKVTGERWTPREVQETIWSWAKTLYEAREAAGEIRSAAQLIAQRALTDLQIGGTPDFAILLKDNPALRAVLKEAGYEQQINDLAGTSGAVYGDAPGFLGIRSGPQDATGSGFSQRDYERRLGRAAGRLDDLAKRRASAAREERVRTTRFDLRGDGGVPRAYARGSGGGGALPRFLGQPVAATYTPERAYQRAYAKNQIEMPDVYELPANVKAGAAYAKRMQEAASRSKFGAAVNVYSPEEYADMRLFVAADGKSGFALKGDDIVSVWSDPKGPSGRTDSLLPLAVQMGGRRLDAFDTVLPRLYARHGFRIESRLGWNDEFAPIGWDKGTYARFNNGEPDVVFMVWDPAYKGAPSAKDGVRAASYEEALTAQLEAQKAIADRIAREYKSTSSTFLAATPFAAVGGAGLGMSAMQSEERPNAFVQ